MATQDIYRDLSPIKGQRLKFSSATPFTPTFIQSSLANHTSSANVYTSRVQNKQILLENPAKESNDKKARDARKIRRLRDQTRRKAGVIGRKEVNEKRLWEFNKECARYDVFLPIHHLWLGYMAELLGLPARPSSSLEPVPSMPNPSAMQAKLVKADFHGSIVRVRKSRNSSLVGCEGIVIHETENTFKVVTLNNKLKVLPKQNSIFVISIPLYGPPPDDSSPTTTSTTTLEPAIEFELYGNHFRFRSADRASRKFKPKETIEL